MALPDYILTTQLTLDTTQPAATIWDCKTGSIIAQYKSNGPIPTNCISIANGSHILATERTKPLLHVWPLNGTLEDNKKIILASVPNAMCLDPSNELIAMGIGMQLYVWMLKTGCLITVQQKHYQAITCVKMNEGYLLAGGLDGFLVSYNLSDLISLYSSSDVPALYIKNDHSLSITDIYINVFGPLKGRFVTTSRDHTARIYELATGRMLLTIFNPEPVTTVVGNLQFSTLYLGAANGDIYSIYLKNPPRGLETHNQPTNDNLFTGSHSKAITSLSISLTSLILASASNDNSVVIWDIKSRQLLRKFEHKYCVSNVIFLPICNVFKNSISKMKSTFIIKSLGRTVETDVSKHIHCVLQTMISCFDDEDESIKENKMNSLQIELEQANTLNHKMYAKVLELLKDKSTIV